MARAGLTGEPASVTSRASVTKRVAALGLLLGLTATLLFVTSLPATCPMRVVLHVPCPSCGLTRAARCVLAGDFAGATRLHPLWMVIFPYLALVGTLQFAHYVRHGTWAHLGKGVVLAGQVLLALLVVVWVARFFGAFGGPAAV